MKISAATLAVLIIPTLIVIGGIYIVESSYEQKVIRQISNIQSKLELQNHELESKFDAVIKSQEGYAKLSGWDELPHRDKFNPEIGGISEELEVDKRTIAQHLIKSFEFQSFGITTLDGQMYLLKPFEDQVNLSRYNFADREWFQGVLNTKETYISNVFVSSATNHPIIVISTPLFSEEKEMIGMWGGGMDLEFLTEHLRIIQNNEMGLILTDANDITIVDTRDSTFHQRVSNNIIEFKDKNQKYVFDSDIQSHLFYSVIKLQNQEWDLFAIVPEENFLLVEKQKKIEAYGLLVVLQSFTLIAGYVVCKKEIKNRKLSEDLQKNQEKLLKQERFSAIGELSARIAHDIKNPLSNIKLSRDLIKRKIRNGELEEYFEKMDKNIFRISHQVDDVLGFLKIYKLKKEETKINEIINNSINSLPIPENVSIDIQECDFKVNVDKINIERVFSNLVLNSIQAINGNDGKISISIEREKETSVISQWKIQVKV